MIRMGLKCNVCGDVIFSKDRHDFKRCKCGSCFVDGGGDYFRYGGNNFTVVKCTLSKSNQLIGYKEDDDNECR